jgi:ABC-type sugar transport system ATPase subunit
VVGLAGIIGSGRHALTRALIGRHAARGSARVNGRELPRAAPARVIGHSIGFVPEDRKQDGIVPDLSVATNLSLPWLRELSVAGVVRSSLVHGRGRKLIERLRLACSSSWQPAGDLSGGNQQKAVLGRWFGSAVPIVLLESPTVGVDVAGKEEIRHLVRALAASGAGVLVSTDDMWELEQLTDRILVMVRGALTAEFATRTMRHADLLAALTGANGG